MSGKLEVAKSPRVFYDDFVEYAPGSHHQPKNTARPPITVCIQRNDILWHCSNIIAFERFGDQRRVR